MTKIKNVKSVKSEQRKERREERINLVVGIVEDMKTNENGAVRYKIAYKTDSGREHRAWSNWMRNDGYQIGSSIPLKALNVPGTFELISVPIEVNRSPQRRVEPYAVSLALAAMCGLLAGLLLGKDKD